MLKKKLAAWSIVLGLMVMFLGAASCSAPKNPVAYAPIEGDVVFQSLPRNAVVDMIEGATGSPYSHCGIVAGAPGKWVVYESLGTVHATPLAEFLARGRGGFYEVYRLKPVEDKSLPHEVVLRSKEYVGRPYDFRYRMDPEAIYCSELIYRAYEGATGKPLGKLVKVKDLNWKPYEKTIRRLEGDGSLPLEREMITPRDLAAAPELEKVYSTEAEN